MRSLNTSLPQSPSKKRPSHPPEQLIQAFKNAALSVTTLYKKAAEGEYAAREAGYQEALDELLAFLDRENIGLGDGEGWRIRQWATGRLDGSPAIAASNESDDDQADVAKRARSHSPAVPPKSAEQDNTQIHSRSASPVRASSTPLNPSTSPQRHSKSIHAPEIFTFQSNIPFPQDTEMQADEPTDRSPTPSSPRVQPQTTLPTPTRKVGVGSRNSRSTNKNGTFSNRVNARALPSTWLSGPGTGSKRKFTLGDYFDIGSLGDIKDSQGGGKRGRFN